MSESNFSGMQDSFFSHLVELRDRLVKACYGIAIACAILFSWPGPTAIYDFLAQPMIESLPPGSKLIAIGVVSSFMVPMKLTLLLSFVLALPWVLYQAWAFIAPGLYAHEKRLVAPLVISSSLLFVAGASFCYFVVFQRVFKFIAEFAPTSITVSPDIENYLDFIMSMCFAFGMTFEVPIVVIVLVRTGLVTVEKFKAIRSYVIVGVTAIAAVVTPPDLFSMFSLAVPMYLLFELGLLVAPIFVKATQAPEQT